MYQRRLKSLELGCTTEPTPTTSLTSSQTSRPRAPSSGAMHHLSPSCALTTVAQSVPTGISLTLTLTPPSPRCNTAKHHADGATKRRKRFTTCFNYAKTPELPRYDNSYNCHNHTPGYTRILGSDSAKDQLRGADFARKALFLLQDEEQAGYH